VSASRHQGTLSATHALHPALVLAKASTSFLQTGSLRRQQAGRQLRLHPGVGLSPAAAERDSSSLRVWLG
jgi:hypothetical protein